MKQFHGLFLLLIILSSCDTVKSYDPSRELMNMERDLQVLFAQVENNSVIDLEKGEFIFGKRLVLKGKENVTIRGTGITGTALSFKDQIDGSEGILIANCKNIILEDFSVEDAAGVNIRVMNTDGITIRNVKSAWTGIVNEKNGVYGMYHVLCMNVLVEGCEVLGARGTGIYAEQSVDVIIRNNIVYWNVTGIVSGNSVNVRINNNRVYENTGGIMVTDLPGLRMTGGDIEVYSNEIYKNNLWNFAPTGNIVSIVPPGTGMLILATRKMDVRDNQIKDNRTIGIGIISYELVNIILENEEEVPLSDQGPGQYFDQHYKEDLEYDPHPGEIRIHDNQYSSRYVMPDLRSPFGKIFLWKFGFRAPYIVWDGIKPEGFILANGRMNPAYRICVQEDDHVKRVILDFANDFRELTTDPGALTCD